MNYRSMVDSLWSLEEQFIPNSKILEEKKKFKAEYETNPATNDQRPTTND